MLSDGKSKDCSCPQQSLGAVLRTARPCPDGVTVPRTGRTCLRQPAPAHSLIHQPLSHRINHAVPLNLLFIPALGRGTVDHVLLDLDEVACDCYNQSRRQSGPDSGSWLDRMNHRAPRCCKLFFLSNGRRFATSVGHVAAVPSGASGTKDVEKPLMKVLLRAHDSRFLHRRRGFAKSLRKKPTKAPRTKTWLVNQVWTLHPQWSEACRPGTRVDPADQGGR